MLEASRSLAVEASVFLRTLLRERDYDAKPKVNHCSVDKHGQAHAKGGMFNATGGRDVQLSIQGFTKKEITAFNRHLKAKLGYAIPIALAESLLGEARYLGVNLSHDSGEQRRAKWREKRRRQVERKRERHECLYCPNPTFKRKDGTQAATCVPCQDKANQAKKGAS